MIVCLDETPSQRGRILHGHGRARGHVRHHGMAGVPQQYQTTLAPRIERLDVQDWPLRELRSRFDHRADFRVKARKRVYDLFSGAELPRRLRMPIALRAGHKINLVARLLDVIDQNVAVRSPPFGAVAHLHAAEQRRRIDRSMRDRAGEARLARTHDRLAELGVHAVRADHHVRLGLRSVGEAHMHHVAALLHIGEPPAERDCTGLDFFQDRRMQIVAVNGDVAGAVLSLAGVAERQLEQNVAGVPLSTSENIGVDTDLAQPLLCTKSAEYLHDIRRNVNACADSLKGRSLFVYPYWEALALQPSGCSRASKSSSNDCNASAAPHLRHSPQSRRRRLKYTIRVRRQLVPRYVLVLAVEAPIADEVYRQGFLCGACVAER